MSRLHRYFVEALSSAAGEAAAITGDEAHHAAAVLRVKLGDRVTLFDGSGCAAQAIVEHVDKRRVEVRIAEITPPEQARFVLTIAVAPPKGDFDELVVRLAELGVHRVIPVQSDYGEVDLSRKARDTFAERMRRLAIRAAKQCGRNTLIEVGEQLALKDLPGRVAVCHTRGSRTALADIVKPGELTLLIGPEGGWSEAECALFTQRGWPSVELPGHVLRTATAAICAAAVAMEAEHQSK